LPISARAARAKLARSRLAVEQGFTIMEALVAAVVLMIGLVGLLGMLIAGNHATSANRERQASTSLAREVIENIRSLGYSQIVTSSLPSTLESVIPGSTLSGSTLVVTRDYTPGSPNPATATFDVSVTECSLDDPADGYGNHSLPPESGGSWCPDVAASGTTDTNPDDYKRVSVTVTPTSGSTTSAVQQTILVYNRPTNGPAVSCLSTTTSCPGTNQTITSGSSLTFNVTATASASAVQWLVNGSAPPASEVSTTDPFTTSGTTSSFTWVFPTADGTYTIAARVYDSNGNVGTESTLQITLNRHQAIAPTSLTAGWNAQIGGVDVQWVPSVDQDILYYNVYHRYGSGPAILACSHVTGTSCTDMSAVSPNPSTEPTCTSTNQSYTTSNNYWVVGVDTDPSTGLPRESTNTSPTDDANLCDHPPHAPTGLTGTLSGGSMTLSWTAPSPADPDSWDSIQEWRIYRWPTSQSATFPGSRLDLVGSKNGSGNPVTSYTDSSPDPGGVTQDYCVTAVDTHLDESACSNVVSG
jgi:type II secretory pathway pseudopilin PulG